MEAPLDLYRASREDLIALVLRQREQIAELEREQARVRAEVAAQHVALAHLQVRVGTLLALLDPGTGDDAPTRPTSMPGLKPAAPRAVPAARRPTRKRRAHGYGRKRMRPTARQVHA